MVAVWGIRWGVVVGGRKTELIRLPRQWLAASFAFAAMVVAVLVALPLRRAAAADPDLLLGTLGGRRAAADTPLHRDAAGRVSGQRLQETRSPARPQAVRVELDTPSLAPLAFVRFCLHYARECEVRDGEADQGLITLTQMRLTDLLEVNRVVNHLIAPRPNPDILHAEWHIAPRQGDCSDYAVTKRHELLARGWPSGALLLAEVILPSREHHLVLVVRTREDDLVLDNLSSDIRPASQSDYRWLRMQRKDNPNYWLASSMARAQPAHASAF